MVNFNPPFIYYGGDYNPDQWPEDIWKEDVRLFRKAGINTVTLPVFSWARLQPSENTYEFGWLDRVFQLMLENGIRICLATSTAVQPAWMSKKYPGMLPVDFEGRRRKTGGRVNFCPNSPEYRELSQRLAGKLAERYGSHLALELWHIGNEYGNYCYCDVCTSAFRDWLRKRYGTLEEINKRWNLSFWGHTIYSWDEIEAPSGLSEMRRDGDREITCFQGMSLDYNRFMSESSLACYLGEYRAIRQYCSDRPITTNLMGTFKPLDYFSWARHMDVIAWDSYPAPSDPPSAIAMRHDLMRGLKEGQPFMLMEQTPSQQNWAPYNTLKRPGVMRLLSYQAAAHGADAIMFFQMRRSVGGCEKFHGAVIEHAGREDARVFRECAELGRELSRLGDRFTGSRLKAEAALVFDWEVWWAVEFSSGPSVDLKYVRQAQKHYKAFYELNTCVDFISSEGDLSKYKLLVAPLLYMLKPGVAERLKDFVRNGGILIATFFTGIVDGSDLVLPGGYPGTLKELLGIWVEETDALLPGAKNSIDMICSHGEPGGSYECGLLCDIMHLEGAQVLGVYGRDFYSGTPAFTVNHYGKGAAYYIASDPEERFLTDLVRKVCFEDLGIKPPFTADPGVEVTLRYKDRFEFVFVMNHNDHPADIDLGACCFTDLLRGGDKQGMVRLEAKDVLILERST